MLIISLGTTLLVLSLSIVANVLFVIDVRKKNEELKKLLRLAESFEKVAKREEEKQKELQKQLDETRKAADEKEGKQRAKTLQELHNISAYNGSEVGQVNIAND